MSKASEWANTKPLDRSPYETFFDKTGRRWRTVATVGWSWVDQVQTADLHLRYRTVDTQTAIALARWILDTFEDAPRA